MASSFPASLYFIIRLVPLLGAYNSARRMWKPSYNMTHASVSQSRSRALPPGGIWTGAEGGGGELVWTEGRTECRSWGFWKPEGRRSLGWFSSEAWSFPSAAGFQLGPEAASLQVRVSASGASSLQATPRPPVSLCLWGVGTVSSARSPPAPGHLHPDLDPVPPRDPRLHLGCPIVPLCSPTVWAVGRTTRHTHTAIPALLPFLEARPVSPLPPCCPHGGHNHLPENEDFLSRSTPWGQGWGFAWAFLCSPSRSCSQRPCLPPEMALVTHSGLCTQSMQCLEHTPVL